MGMRVRGFDYWDFTISHNHSVTNYSFLKLTNRGFKFKVQHPVPDYWLPPKQSKAAIKNINTLPQSAVSFRYQPQSHAPSHGTTA